MRRCSGTHSSNVGAGGPAWSALRNRPRSTTNDCWQPIPAPATGRYGAPTGCAGPRGMVVHPRTVSGAVAW